MADNSGIKIASFTLVVFVIGLLFGVGLITSFSNVSPTTHIMADNNQPSQQLQKQDQQVAPSMPVVDAKNIMDDDPSIGPVDAKIVVVEFADFECPYCGAVEGSNEQAEQYLKSRDPEWEPAVPKLKELAKQGKIRFVYRDFPLPMHKNAQKASEASECADEQGKFWQMHDKIFENQGAISITDLKDYASGLYLNMEQFNSCLDSGKYSNEVKKDYDDGNDAGVTGTPTFFVNGVEINGAQPASVFLELVNKLSSG